MVGISNKNMTGLYDNIDNFAHGKGLKKSELGRPVLFTVDGRNSPRGELSCRCEAPSGKVSYVLINDNKDGTYIIDLNVKEYGTHNVEISWDGKPVKGSPFMVRIAPTTVLLTGRGLTSGVIDTFNGIFHVDIRDKDPGELKVQIKGPKDSFKVEKYRTRRDERIINFRYNPIVPGLYFVHVLWCGCHVMGSPFEVYVAPDQEQLEKWEKDPTAIRKKYSYKKSNIMREVSV